MQTEVTSKELVAAGHQLAKILNSACPLLDVAKLVSDLATRLDCAVVRGNELQQKLDALAAEMSVVETIHDECASVTDEDYEACPKNVQKIIRSLAVMQIPATDAWRNSVRAEGIHFAANRMLAAWDSGFIDDTPAQAYDISGAVLSAVEFLPNASPEEFKRDFADSIRSEIKASTASAGKDGE